MVRHRQCKFINIQQSTKTTPAAPPITDGCKFINIQQSTKTAIVLTYCGAGCKFINIQQSTKTCACSSSSDKGCKFINIQQSTKTGRNKRNDRQSVSLSISNRVLKPLIYSGYITVSTLPPTVKSRYTGF